MYSTVLNIKKITKSQEGVYRIKAKNREGETSVQFTLKVQTGNKEPPQILEPLYSVTVKENSTITLTTTIFGNPKPSVTWLKNGVPLTTPKPTERDNSHSLTITQVKVEDAAEYTVKATNNLGTAETSAKLTVDGNINVFKYT